MLETKIALMLANLSKEEWFRKAIGFIIIIPIALFMLISFLLISVFSSIIGTMHDTSSLHAEVIIDLQIEKNISGTLSSYIVRSIDMLDDGVVFDNENDIRRYLNSYFVDENVSYEEDETGKITTTITYSFKSEDSIYTMILSEPFNLTESDIEFIKAFEIFNTSFTGSLLMPCRGRFTSTYGPRIHPITGKSSFHTGIDIVPAHHSEIISVANGIVYDIDTRNGNAFGNNVTIKHTLNGVEIYSNYAHLSKIYVKVGDTLNAGDVIGLEGGEPNVDPNVGLSTGHHLHFEIWTGNSRKHHTDPRKYLSD